MVEPLLEATGLSRAFGAVRAVDGVNLSLHPGEIHALIGPNGAGKSTLLALLSGQLRPDGGQIRFQGRDITPAPLPIRVRLGLARSFQITSIFPGLSVHENVALGAQARAARSHVFWRPAHVLGEVEAATRQVLARVGLDGVADQPAGTLPHGRKRELEIAMALATEPRALLLDEPMAGVGPTETRALAHLLDTLRDHTALLLVEHDMGVVFDLADRISVLDGGRLVASGGPEAIRADHGVRHAYLGTAAA